MPYATPPAPPAIIQRAAIEQQAASYTAARPVFVPQHRRAAWPPSSALRGAVRAKVGRVLGARVTGATSGARYGRWFITTNGAAPWRTVQVDFDRQGRGLIYPSASPQPVRCCEADPSRGIVFRVDLNPRKRSW